MITLRILAVLVLLGLGGCGVKPVQYAGTPGQECSAVRTRVAIEPPQAIAIAARSLTPDALSPLERSDPLARKVVGSYRAAAKEKVAARSLTITAAGAPAGEAVSPSMLFLSGGSQNGAFGAGLMQEWAAQRRQAGHSRGLPRFRVITGISTGALQSTFAFLDEPDVIVDRYAITQEGQLLHPLVKRGLKGGSSWDKFKAGLTVARRGALADLDPLRQTLRTLIDDSRLHRVADESNAGRFLLVGAVEMDSGDAYVFDLTEVARLYVAATAANDTAGAQAMKDCYVEALIASASVPMSAMPAFIDGKMYIDGGARFGVISDETAAMFEQAAGTLDANEPRNLFIIVNGNLEAGVLCHLNDCGTDPTPPTPAGDVPQAPKWTFDAVALRSLSILINESYRSSVYWTTEEAKRRGFVPHFARIGTDLAAHQAVVHLPPEPDAAKSCADWSKLDDTLDHPLEFHPRFMRCEIDYGRNRDEARAWAALE